MRVKTVNIGQPREIPTPKGVTLTSIFKSPVEGRVAVKRLNVAGDRQADIRVHGGVNKAVYAYASEHYPFWTHELRSENLPPGSFGENLTTEGLFEQEAQIGDEYRVGTAILKISQPRMPCFKLALRFALPEMVKLFWKSLRSGMYFAVLQEGEVGAGDGIELLNRPANSATVKDVVRVYQREETDAALVERVLASPLTGSWKEDIRERLANAAS